MKKKYIKIFFILILVLLLGSSIFLNISNASSAIDHTLENIDKGNDTTNVSNTIGEKITVILVVTKIIGLGVALTMLMVIAMKYMTAAPGDKADIKKSSTVYVFGAILLFGAVAVLQLIQTFSTVFMD